LKGKADYPIYSVPVLGLTPWSTNPNLNTEVSAAVLATKDALHLKKLLVDLDLSDPLTPLQIGEDNSACIAQAESGIRHVRKHVRNAKHYEIRLRFLQELVVDKRVEFVYCPTDLQLADFFTKPLDSIKFCKFRDTMMTWT